MSYDIMEVLEILDTYETALKKGVDGYKTHILNIRAGRANPHILDKVMVDYSARRLRSIKWGVSLSPKPR